MKNNRALCMTTVLGRYGQLGIYQMSNLPYVQRYMARAQLKHNAWCHARGFVIFTWNWSTTRCQRSLDRFVTSISPRLVSQWKQTRQVSPCCLWIAAVVCCSLRIWVNYRRAQWIRNLTGTRVFFPWSKKRSRVCGEVLLMCWWSGCVGMGCRGCYVVEDIVF